MIPAIEIWENNTKLSEITTVDKVSRIWIAKLTQLSWWLHFDIVTISLENSTITFFIEKNFPLRILQTCSSDVLHQQSKNLTRWVSVGRDNIIIVINLIHHLSSKFEISEQNLLFIFWKELTETGSSCWARNWIRVRFFTL